MKIVLAQKTTIIEGLTYEQGIKAMEKASKSPASKYMEFGIAASSESESMWTLFGYSHDVMKAFINKPRDFIIDTEE
jgi:hypothetical protein